PKIRGLKQTLLFRPGIIVTNVSLREQASTIPTRSKEIHHCFIVPIAEFVRAAVKSLAYARSISHRVIAAHVAIETHDADAVRSRWNRFQGQLAEDEETQLVIIESPYRSLARPLLAYIDTVHELHPKDTLTVILPEFVVAHWWEHFLHNQTALRLKAALLFSPGIVVTDIPLDLSSSRDAVKARR